MSAELSSKAENDVSRRASSSEEEEAYHSASEDMATSTIAAAREGEGSEGGGREEVVSCTRPDLCLHLGGGAEKTVWGTWQHFRVLCRNVCRANQIRVASDITFSDLRI